MGEPDPLGRVVAGEDRPVRDDLGVGVGGPVQGGGDRGQLSRLFRVSGRQGRDVGAQFPALPPEHRPALFQQLERPVGPSGAGHLGRRFIDVNCAEIESRYVGDTPKNIVRCFQAAARDDAVLIFNEADSILGSRLSQVTQSGDHSVNVSRAVMLAQLDHFTGLVIFTSNFPRNYDVAFVRRILAHVPFELPDEPTRRQLWGVLLPSALPLALDVDTGVLAARSAGLAGGEMVNGVLAAAAAVIRDGDARRIAANFAKVRPMTSARNATHAETITAALDEKQFTGLDLNARDIAGTGFSYRHDWGQHRGKLILTLTWAGFTGATRVFVAAAEGGGQNGNLSGMPATPFTTSRRESAA